MFIGILFSINILRKKNISFALCSIKMAGFLQLLIKQSVVILFCSNSKYIES
jgi:hypothetical protein